MSGPCRCLPSFNSALLMDVVSAADRATTILVSNSSSPYHQYLDSAGQRLERYIADIQKGFAVIIVSGDLSHAPMQGSLAMLRVKI